MKILIQVTDTGAKQADVMAFHLPNSVGPEGQLSQTARDAMEHATDYVIRHPETAQVTLTCQRG